MATTVVEKLLDEMGDMDAEIGRLVKLIHDLTKRVKELEERPERHTHHHYPSHIPIVEYKPPPWQLHGNCNCREENRGKFTGGWHCPIHGQQY